MPSEGYSVPICVDAKSPETKIPYRSLEVVTYNVETLQNFENYIPEGSWTKRAIGRNKQASTVWGTSAFQFWPPVVGATGRDCLNPWHVEFFYMHNFFYRKQEQVRRNSSGMADPTEAAFDPGLLWLQWGTTSDSAQVQQRFRYRSEGTFLTCKDIFWDMIRTQKYVGMKKSQTVRDGEKCFWCEETKKKWRAGIWQLYI